MPLHTKSGCWRHYFIKIFTFECFVVVVVFLFCYEGELYSICFPCLACLPRVRYRCHKVRHQKMMSLHQSSKKADFKGGTYLSESRQDGACKMAYLWLIA